MIPFFITIAKLTLKSKQYESDVRERIATLKTSGVKIEVNLLNLKIKTNSYNKEITVGSGRSERTETIFVVHNIALLKIPYADSYIEHRIESFMDTDIFKMQLSVQGKTFIYIDKENKNSYYLDLEFFDK